MNVKQRFKKEPFILANELASKACGILDVGSAAYNVAKSAKDTISINYMRCREFQGVSDGLDLHEGESVLDVSSPQWYTICQAYLNPKVSFYYVNITENELAPYREIAKVLNLTNLTYGLEDVRGMETDKKYNWIYSVSVIEHVYPEVGGDVIAYTQIKQLLLPGASAIITVPYKEEKNTVMQKGDVYERKGEGLQFFSREYDSEQFDKLENAADFIATRRQFIVEHVGLFSLDYYEWGAAQGSIRSKLVLNFVKILRRVFKDKFDAWVAEKYYSIVDAEEYRLVNIIATYKV